MSGRGLFTSWQTGNRDGKTGRSQGKRAYLKDTPLVTYILQVLPAFLQLPLSCGTSDEVRAPWRTCQLQLYPVQSSLAHTLTPKLSQLPTEGSVLI